MLIRTNKKTKGEVYLQDPIGIDKEGNEITDWVEEGKIKLIGVNLYPKLDAKKTTEELYSATEIKPVRWAEMFE